MGSAFFQVICNSERGLGCRQQLLLMSSNQLLQLFTKSKFLELGKVIFLLDFGASRKFCFFGSMAILDLGVIAKCYSRQLLFLDPITAFQVLSCLRFVVTVMLTDNIGRLNGS